MMIFLKLKQDSAFTAPNEPYRIVCGNELTGMNDAQGIKLTRLHDFTFMWILIFSGQLMCITIRLAQY